MKFAQFAPKALLLVLTTVFLAATCLAQDTAPPPVVTAPVVVTVLQGKVVDRSTGAAVIDAFVEWKHGDRAQHNWTDASGAYAFAIPAQDQDDDDARTNRDDARADQRGLVVSIRANLYRGAKANVQVHSGKPSILNFALTPKPAGQIGVLSGRVTNASNGQDVGGVSISILNAGGVLSTLTNSDGTYTISGVGFSDGLVLQVKPGPILRPSGTEDDNEGTKSSPCFAPIDQSFEMASPALEKNFTLNVVSIPNLPPNLPCPGPRPSGRMPPPPPGIPGAGELPDDTSMQWQQADVSEISINHDIDKWNSGHVNDILKLNRGAGLLVGTDSGGVWLIPPKGPATPLSNAWGSVNIDALAFGADGPNDIYAGTYGGDNYPCCSLQGVSPGGILFETDTSTPDPLKNWLPVQNNTYLPNGITTSPPCGAIYRILVINEVRRIVLACANGIWWSPIPSTPPSAAQGIYQWKRAIPDAALLSLNNLLDGSSPYGANGFTGLAKGLGWSPATTGAPAAEGTIVASSNGGITPQQLIYYGEWSNGDLVFHSANVPNPAAQTFGFQDIGRTSVASCLIDPGLMFAVGADPDDSADDIRGTWKSQDGGQNWSVVSSPPDPGNQGGYNNAIAISSDCSTIAVAWRNFTFVSFDGGASWTHLGFKPLTVQEESDQTASPHGDYHAVTFDPADPTTLYMGSDGGVFSLSGVVANADLVNSAAFVSDYNQYLFDLQFFHAAAIPDPQEYSLVVAGALQDNGIIETVVPETVVPAPDWWSVVGTGDGFNIGFVIPITNGAGRLGIALLADDASAWRGDETNPFGVPPSQSTNQIPLSGTSSTYIDPTWGTPLAVVRFPRFSLAGQKMYAVAGACDTSLEKSCDATLPGCVFGLFANDDGTGLNWEELACLPGQTITALSSYDGNNIFFGTDHGNIYLIQYISNSCVLCFSVFQVTQLPITQPPSVQGNEAITAILEVLPGIAFAALQVGGQGYVLEWQQQPQTWEVVGGGFLPNDVPFTALESSPGVLLLPTLFAATGTRVYDTHDLGNFWAVASDGLPMVTHGVDLHSVVQPDGTKYLYLATFGRSLWRAVLPYQ
jgi:hypothetical protein